MVGVSACLLYVPVASRSDYSSWDGDLMWGVWPVCVLNMAPCTSVILTLVSIKVSAGWKCSSCFISSVECSRADFCLPDVILFMDAFLLPLPEPRHTVQLRAGMMVTDDINYYIERQLMSVNAYNGFALWITLIVQSGSYRTTLTAGTTHLLMNSSLLWLKRRGVNTLFKKCQANQSSLLPLKTNRDAKSSARLLEPNVYRRLLLKSFIYTSQRCLYSSKHQV